MGIMCIESVWGFSHPKADTLAVIRHCTYAEAWKVFTDSFGPSMMDIHGRKLMMSVSSSVISTVLTVTADASEDFLSQQAPLD